MFSSEVRRTYRDFADPSREKCMNLKLCIFQLKWTFRVSQLKAYTIKKRIRHSNDIKVFENARGFNCGVSWGVNESEMF